MVIKRYKLVPDKLAPPCPVTPLLSKTVGLHLHDFFLQCFYYSGCLKSGSSLWNKRVYKQKIKPKQWLTIVSSYYTTTHVNGLRLLCLSTYTVYSTEFILHTE